MSTATKQHSPDAVINPLEEALAYETLLAYKDNTEVKLEKEFPSTVSQSLSQILEDTKRNFSHQEIAILHRKIQTFFTDKIKDFAICVQGDFHYPQHLGDAQYPLKLFYYTGFINLLENDCISVVGARQATELGLKQAQMVTEILIENNFTVVSGLAKGIDTMALKTAIENQGQVIAVIGTPLNQYYPSENRELQDIIAQKHLLISHVPFYKYYHESFPQRRLYFPKRNATMSALSLATIIIEATDTSGTVIQAQAAMKQNRKLFILKSCFDKYKWPHKFLQEGAIKINSLEQLKNELKNLNNDQMEKDNK